MKLSLRSGFRRKRSPRRYALTLGGIVPAFGIAVSQGVGSAGGSGSEGGYTLRNVAMPGAPGLTSGGQTNQAGATYSSGTTTISGKNITSTITVSGTANVTITNCSFTFGAYYMIQMSSSGTLTVQNCYFNGDNSAGGNLVAINQTNDGVMDVLSCEFLRCENSIRPRNGQVAYNYIHGPCKLDVGAHSDGIEVYGATANSLVIEYNVIDIRDSYGQTACINCVPYGTADVTGAIFRNNSFIGGSYPLYVQTQDSATCSGIVVTDNMWISQWNGDAGDYTDGPYTYGGVYGTHAITASYVTTWSGNTLDGTPISKT